MQSLFITLFSCHALNSALIYYYLVLERFVSRETTFFSHNKSAQPNNGMNLTFIVRARIYARLISFGSENSNR